MKLFRSRPSGESRRLLVWLVVAVALVAAVAAVGYLAKWEWIGVASYRQEENVVHYKTAWDWLQLLFVPLVIALLGVLFTTRQTEQERAIEDQRAQDEAYTDYLVWIKSLLAADDRSRPTDLDADLRSVASARTVALFRRLDAERKAALLKFLYQTGLVYAAGSPDAEALGGLRSDLHPVISLSGADLSGIDMSDFWLEGINLRGTNLADAVLRGTQLTNAVLTSAHLERADLGMHVTDFGMPASLMGADLRRAILTDAVLTSIAIQGANLRSAKLHRANVRHARFMDEGHPENHASLRWAEFDGADLTGALMSDDHLAGAKSLEGATLPNGTTASGWDRFPYKRSLTQTVIHARTKQEFRFDGFSNCSRLVLPNAERTYVDVYVRAYVRLSMEADGIDGSQEVAMEDVGMYRVTVAVGASEQISLDIATVETISGEALQLEGTMHVSVEKSGKADPVYVDGLRFTDGPRDAA